MLTRSFWKLIWSFLVYCLLLVGGSILVMLIPPTVIVLTLLFGPDRAFEQLANLFDCESFNRQEQKVFGVWMTEESVEWVGVGSAMIGIVVFSVGTALVLK